jgi:hypothetical protein
VPDDDVLNTTDELLEQIEDTANKTDANLMWREVFGFLGSLIQKNQVVNLIKDAIYQKNL